MSSANSDSLLKCHSEKQTSDLTHTFRSLLEHSLEVGNGRYHLCTFTLTHFRTPGSLGREFLHASCALIFMAATNRMSLDCLALEARDACVWSHGTVIIDVIQKGVHTPIQHPDFCGCCQGIPLYCLALATSGDLHSRDLQDCNQ